MSSRGGGSSLLIAMGTPIRAGILSARAFFAELEEKLLPDVIHLNSFREARFDWMAPVLVVAHSCVN